MTLTMRAISGNTVLDKKHYKYTNDYSEKEIAKRLYCNLPGQSDNLSAIVVVFDSDDKPIRRIY